MAGRAHKLYARLPLRWRGWASLSQAPEAPNAVSTWEAAHLGGREDGRSGRGRGHRVSPPPSPSSAPEVRHPRSHRPFPFPPGSGRSLRHKSRSVMQQLQCPGSTDELIPTFRYSGAVGLSLADCSALIFRPRSACAHGPEEPWTFRSLPVVPFRAVPRPPSVQSVVSPGTPVDSAA